MISVNGYHQIPARIHILQGIVPHIRIPVKILCKIGRLNIWIRAQESAYYGVIHAAVHVDQCKFIKVFVAGVAMAGVGGYPLPILRYISPLRSETLRMTVGCWVAEARTGAGASARVHVSVRCRAPTINLTIICHRFHIANLLSFT